MRVRVYDLAISPIATQRRAWRQAYRIPAFKDTYAYLCTQQQNHQSQQRSIVASNLAYYTHGHHFVIDTFCWGILALIHMHTYAEANPPISTKRTPWQKVCPSHAQGQQLGTK